MPSTPTIADRLNRILGDFAGIAPGESRCRADGSGVLAEVSFDDSPAGTAARLAVEHILRRGAAPRTIASDRRVRLSLDARDGLRFARALGYAGTECLAPGRPWQKLETVPLPTLLSHVLIAFEREYGDAGDDVPTLPIWSNVLRVFGAEALTDGELATRGVLAKRVVRVVLRDLKRLAWLEPGAAGSRTARLTERARLLEAAARRRLVEVETAWRHRHGSAVIDGLRGALAEMVTSQELEWPWYLTGYGPSDPSLTGGSFLRTEPGPPRAPGRGTEWPVVPRDTSAPATGLPLSVLLSKVLAAFTIDYEEAHVGPLGAASVFLPQVPDDAVSLERARSICDVIGTGKSAPERHLCVVVEPGRPRDGSRTVYLTPKSRRIRDSYPALVTEIEARWRNRFAGVLAGLRSALETLDTATAPGTPDYPDTRAWLHPASMKARGALGRVAPDGQPVHLAWHSGQSRPADG
ncbi:MAG: hypothetical protein OXM56_10580 [Gammaproteobacteria bacterium]|nr:hypothetical protein [Gammaproteobacteria bacterium]